MCVLEDVRRRVSAMQAVNACGCSYVDRVTLIDREQRVQPLRRWIDF